MFIFKKKRLIVNDSPYYLAFGWGFFSPAFLGQLKSHLEGDWQKRIKLARELDLSEARLGEAKAKLGAKESQIKDLEQRLQEAQAECEQLKKKKKK